MARLYCAGVRPCAIWYLPLNWLGENSAPQARLSHSAPLLCRGTTVPAPVFATELVGRKFSAAGAAQRRRAFVVRAYDRARTTLVFAAALVGRKSSATGAAQFSQHGAAGGVVGEVEKDSSPGRDGRGSHTFPSAPTYTSPTPSWTENLPAHHGEHALRRKWYAPYCGWGICPVHFRCQNLPIRIDRWRERRAGK
jgi:hypothetical protein